MPLSVYEDHRWSAIGSPRESESAKKNIQTDAEVGVFQPPFLPGSPSWFLLQHGSRFFVDYVINITPSRRVLRRCAAQTNRSQRLVLGWARLGRAIGDKPVESTGISLLTPRQRRCCKARQNGTLKGNSFRSRDAIRARTGVARRGSGCCGFTALGFRRHLLGLGRVVFFPGGRIYGGCEVQRWRGCKVHAAPLDRRATYECDSYDRIPRCSVCVHRSSG